MTYKIYLAEECGYLFTFNFDYINSLRINDIKNMLKFSKI